MTGSLEAREVQSRPRRRWAAALVAGAGLMAAGQWLGRTAGSTQSERGRLLPGDELVDNPTVVTNHGVTIPVPPGQVWPWLAQMGWHRGGWSTARHRLVRGCARRPPAPAGAALHHAMARSMLAGISLRAQAVR